MKKLLCIVLLLGLLGAGIWYTCLRVSRPPNVMLIMLDTLRADHLGSYGYSRDTTPNLDQFARAGVRYQHAITTVPWTPPSVATMLSGLYARSHMMMPPDGRELAQQQAKKLSAEVETLPEILKANGYNTLGISPNPWISSEFGYDQGFDTFRLHLRADAKLITDKAIGLIKGLLEQPKPFFAYVHYFDPHDPYTPPAPFDSKFQDRAPGKFNYNERMLNFINKYDGEISFMDNELGRLFDFLQKRGLYENTLVIVVADHGEQFMEHGDHRHGYKLYNEELNVPLLIRAPGQPAAEVSELVSTLDIFPTILEQTRVKYTPHLQGLSLLNFEKLKQRRGIMSEIDRIYHQKSFTSADGKRLIVGTTQSEPPFDGDYFNKPVIVFDSFEDPLAEHPIKEIAWQEELQELLKTTLKLAETQAANTSNDQIELKKETLDQLKSLGYLE